MEKKKQEKGEVGRILRDAMREVARVGHGEGGRWGWDRAMGRRMVSSGG
jgi:hypothetical protein